MVSGGLIRRFSRPKSFRCGLSAPVRAAAVISLLGFLAFLLLLTALPSAPAYAGTPIQGPAQTDYLQDVRGAALGEVDARRDVAQVAPVEVHSALEEAAQQHALYLLLNSDQWGEEGFSAHVEDSGLPGFYATGLGERVDLAGYPHTYVMEDVLRLTSDADYDGESPWPVEKVVGKWIDAPFHRRTVLGESVEEVGFGYATDGYLTSTYWLRAVTSWLLPTPARCSPTRRTASRMSLWSGTGGSILRPSQTSPTPMTTPAVIP